MHQHHGNARRYYACVGAKKGLCGMTTQVPADRAEGELVAFVLGLLGGWPEWVREVYRRTCAAVRSAAERVPAERERDARRATELARQVANLVDALAGGGVDSPAVVRRLRDAEAEKAAVDARLAESDGLGYAAVGMPDEVWVAGRLAAWAGRMAAESGPASLLRHALARVAAESVIAPGKKRGYPRLRFRVNAWTALAAAVGETLPAAVRPFLAKPPEGVAGDPEFVIDLGEPTKMDAWAHQIVEWRADGVTWKEIAARTGMDLNRVYRAWQRYTAANDSGPNGE